MPELTAADVRLAYRFLLGREPESEAVVAQQIQNHRSIEDLRAAFVSSEEFRLKLQSEMPNAVSYVDETSKGYFEKAGHIETDVSDMVLSELILRTQNQWKILGESEPHWSVLTSDRFRRDQLSEVVEEEFYATGRSSAELVEIFEESGRTALTKNVCLELGCGVGRITQFLAEKFNTVVALDISPGNLSLCKARMNKMGLTNIQFVLIDDFTDFEGLPKYDLFYSMIALQHNSPPVQKYMLQKILSRGKRNSAALFQTATHLADYSYNAAEHLANPAEIMDVHALPQPVIFEILALNGYSPRSVVSDAWLAHYGSTTFFASKFAEEDSNE